MKLKIVFFVLFLASPNLWATPARILLIRHAEKPEVESDHLSEKGFQRADAMSELFIRQPALVEKGFPVVFFASKYVAGSHSMRCIETLMPLAKKLNLPVQTPYVTENTPDLAKLILSNKKYDGKTVMIAWTHSKIIRLTKALNAEPPVHEWNSKIFDRIWMIDYDSNGTAKLTDLPQSLLPGDDSSK